MTKRVLVALALASAALAGCHDDALSPQPATRLAADPSRVAHAARAATAGEVVPGQYVVLFRRERVAGGASASTGAALAGATSDLAVRKLAGGRGTLRRTYGHTVQGFAAQLSDSAVAALRADPDVALVEPDHIMRASAGGVESNAPWGLDRIDQERLPLDGQYHSAGDGAGASVYIIDTGINLTHAEFGGRAISGMDFVTSGGTAADCHGHGTHVAGTVGGATYGVAKGVRLVAVRVLDCSGSGSESNVIAALDWVAAQKTANPTTPAVINMSLGGDAAPVLDSAVQRTVAAGVTVVVAAGNSGADACAASPARAPDAITVAATDASDNFAGFSNRGPCVDLAAPGVSIRSAYIGSNTATATLSGTSMATPHVAGVAALYLAANPTAAPARVAAALTTNAIGGPIQGLPANTPMRLLDAAFLSGRGATAGPMLSALTANLCADVAGVSRAPGTPLTVWGCWGGPNQQFALQPTGELTVYGEALCVDAGGTLRDGDPVYLWPCNGTRGQSWTRTTAGQLVTSNGKCLDVYGLSTTFGTRLVVWSCWGGPNQKWSLAASN